MGSQLPAPANWDYWLDLPRWEYPKHVIPLLLGHDPKAANKAAPYSNGGWVQRNEGECHEANVAMLVLRSARDLVGNLPDGRFVAIGELAPASIEPRRVVTWAWGIPWLRAELPAPLVEGAIARGWVRDGTQARSTLSEAAAARPATPGVTRRVSREQVAADYVGRWESGEFPNYKAIDVDMCERYGIAKSTAQGYRRDLGICKSGARAKPGK